MGEQNKSKRKWSAGDGLAATLAILLYLNFLQVMCFAIFSIGSLLLDPVFAFVTGSLLLCGLIGFLVARRLKAAKLWRRLLAGAIGGNLLIIVLYCVIFGAMILAW